MLNVMWERKRE